METRWLQNPTGPLLHSRRWHAGPGAPAAYVGHSQPTHSGNVVPLARALHARGVSVLAGDLRGHGASVSSRHPRGHLDPRSGWASLIADMSVLLACAFDGTLWEDRIIVAPNISALLVLEVLKTVPDLARDIVLISPVPNQPVLPALGRAFVRARMLFKNAADPDEHTLHHLYAFLGAHLKDRTHLADVISADPAVVTALLTDPLAWPTPSLGYSSAIFEGMGSAWRWPKDHQVREDTRVLILYGGEDAMMRDGAFAPAICAHLEQAGIRSTVAARVDGGRSGLFLEEARLGIADRILSWRSGGRIPGADDVSADDMGSLSADVLAGMGRLVDERDLSPEALVDLCYSAIGDEERWIELMYRAAHALADTDDGDGREVESAFARLMPHWDRSFRINRQIMVNATLGVLLQHLVDRLEIGIALVDGAGEVIHHNAVLAATLARVMETEDAPGAPSAMAALVRRLVQSSLAAAAAAAPDTPTDMRPRESVLVFEGRAVGFYCQPPALAYTALQPGGPAGLVVVRAPGEPPVRGDQRAPLLELAYGLTRQEALVALRIVAGDSPEEAAAALGVSVNTIRTHLRRCFEKIDVDGQTRMVARVLSGPVGWLSAEGERPEGAVTG